jgi:heterodisulfide reductase subunit C
LAQKTTEFREAVKKMNAGVCDQCGECPSACPVSDKIKDFNSRQLIARVSLGRIDELLDSEAIWTCTACLKCKERCPEDISPYEVILELRRLAIREGRNHPPGVVDAAKSVAEAGVIQQPQAVRTRHRERKDRSSLGLPPAEKSRDLERARSPSREVLVSLSEVSSRSVKITMDSCD